VLSFYFQLFVLGIIIKEIHQIVEKDESDVNPRTSVAKNLGN